jgi:hypothetical protein
VPPCSPIGIYRPSRGNILLLSSVSMSELSKYPARSVCQEKPYSSETSVKFCRTTLYYIIEMVSMSRRFYGRKFLCVPQDHTFGVTGSHGVLKIEPKNCAVMT